MRGFTEKTASSHDRWLYLLLLLALIVRTYHLAYPPWDYHNWRQTQTLMIARDLARHGSHLLSPQMQWITGDDPPRPTYHSGEFSLESMLAASLYRLFGESELAARLVVIAFSLLGIYFLYSLLARRAGVHAARLGAFIYALLPYSLFFGRVFMPMLPALTLALGGLNYLDHWTDDRSRSKLAAASLLLALAILQHLTIAFVALPALYLFWKAYGIRLLARAESYGFALVVGLPNAAWYLHAQALGSLSGGGIIPVGDVGRHAGRWLDPAFVGEVLRRAAGEAFSPLGLALAAAGFVWPGQGRAGWIFKLWMIGGGALLLLIPEVLRENYYYFLPLVPAVAALAGLMLARLSAYEGSLPLLTLVLIIFAVGAVRTALPLYQIDRSPYDLGQLMNRLTGPDDLIVTQCGGSPTVLYAADRRGWIGAKFDIQFLERLSRLGAKYFASAFPPNMDEQQVLYPALNAKFQRVSAEGAYWQIYDLGPPLSRLREVPAGEIQNPYPVVFADQIEFLGLSSRPLLDWAASFEVIYYWRCLKKIPNNLRVFVHVTTTSGQTVYQQDHWPQDGRAPTSSWEVGDIIRERYVLVLPNGLAEVSYRLQLGWFDPQTGARLPIAHPAASDRDNRASVADLTVHAPPKYRWLQVKY